MPHQKRLRAVSPPAGRLQRMHRRLRQLDHKGLHRRQGTLGDEEDSEDLLPTAGRPAPSLRPGREGGSPADLLSSLFSEGQAAVTSILQGPQDEENPFESLTRCSQGCFDSFFPSDCRDDDCICRSPNELQQASACIAADCRGTDQRGFLASVGEQCGSAQSLSLALAAAPSTATSSSPSSTSSSTTSSSGSSSAVASSTSETAASSTSPSSSTSRSSSASASIASLTSTTLDAPSTIIATVLPSTTLDVDNALSNNASNASSVTGSADNGGISTGQAVGIAFGLILGLLALGLCAWQTRRQLAGRTQRAREFYRTSKPGEWIPDKSKGAGAGEMSEKREMPNHSVPGGQRLSQKIPLDGQFWAGVKQAPGISREAAPSPLPENPFGVRMQPGQIDGASYAGIGRRSLVPLPSRASTLPISPAPGLHSIAEDQDASPGRAHGYGAASLGASLSSHDHLQQQTPYSSQTRLSAMSSSQMAYVPTSPLQSPHLASPPPRTSSAPSMQQRAAPYTHFSLASHAPPSPPLKTGEARSSTAVTPLLLPGSAFTFERHLPPPNSPASSSPASDGTNAAPASPLKQLILPALQSTNAQATSNAYRPRPKSRGNSVSSAMSPSVGTGASRQPVAVSPASGYARSRPGSAASIRSAAQVPLPTSPPLSGRSEDTIPEEQEQEKVDEKDQTADKVKSGARPTLARAPDSARSDASFEGLAYLVPHFQKQGQR